MRKDRSVERALLLKAISEGASTIPEASKMAGLNYSTVKAMLGYNHELRDELREAIKGTKLVIPPSEGMPPFERFREQVWGHKTFPHQQEWIDAIDASHRVLILVPPEHAKSMTITVEYTSYRLMQNRNTRAIVISKSAGMAEKWLFAIKKRLYDIRWYEDNGWRDPISEWGPFRPREHDRNLPWTQRMIYLLGRDSGEKDPSVEALGVGKQIQGARADLIILDDIATLANQMTEREREKILDWISQEVITRLGRNGKLLVIGTRVHEADIYSHFLDEDEPWLRGYTKVIRPAILDEDRREVLWDDPEVGWPYEALAARREETKPRTWSLVYQQQSTGMPDQPFQWDRLEASRDNSYSVSQRSPGMVCCMGIDPALVGYMGAIVTGVDPSSRLRYVIDAVTEKGLTEPENLKRLVVEMAARYRVIECRVEKNAMQGFFSRDYDLRNRLANVGCRLLEEEYTGRADKFDPEWGVMSVADQVNTLQYRFPDGPGSQSKMRPLFEQLASWRPGIRMTQDLVMAMWLAELSCRRHEGGTDIVRIPSKAPPWVRQRGWGARGSGVRAKQTVKVGR